MCKKVRYTYIYMYVYKNTYIYSHTHRVNPQAAERVQGDKIYVYADIDMFIHLEIYRICVYIHIYM